MRDQLSCTLSAITVMQRNGVFHQSAVASKSQRICVPFCTRRLALTPPEGHLIDRIPAEKKTQNCVSLF